jgi:glycosyltransferase involved in cell wall biosynthesis
MTKIILIGAGSLPFEKANVHYAAALRTWQLARILLKAGHQVCLVGLKIDTREKVKDRDIEPEDLEPVELNLYNKSETFADIPLENLIYYKVHPIYFDTTDLLDKLCKHQKAAGVIAIGNYASFFAAQLKAPVPLWVDLFGSVMAEGQAKAYTYDDNSFIYHSKRMELQVLERADSFSTVSLAQKYALIGELGLYERLGKESYGQDLVAVMPATFDNTPPEQHNKQVVRGVICPEDAFILLWSGGFNTWTDIDTLFAGVNLAMSRQPKLHMVITGGQIDGHDEVTFPRFRSLIEDSLYRERYHLEGWVSSEILHNYYIESNLGIILDKWSYEGLLGSRTRVLEWGRYYLPFITSVTSEIMIELSAANAILTFPHGNSQALADQLVRLAGEIQNGNKTELEQLKHNFTGFIKENYTAEKVFKPVLEWAEKPQHAVDYRSDYLQRYQNPHITKLKTELATKEYQIKLLQQQLQNLMENYSELRDWAASIERQLLLK